jgi:hypothetical protein
LLIFDTSIEAERYSADEHPYDQNEKWQECKRIDRSLSSDSFIDAPEKQDDS